MSLTLISYYCECIIDCERSHRCTDLRCFLLYICGLVSERIRTGDRKRMTARYFQYTVAINYAATIVDSDATADSIFPFKLLLITYKINIIQSSLIQ